MLPGALTAWLGTWTVEVSIQVAPTDAGDITLTTTLDGLVHSNTNKPVFAIASFVSFDVIGAGKGLLWRMYKHPNTGGWTSSYIRMTVSYKADY